MLIHYLRFVAFKKNRADHTSKDTDYDTDCRERTRIAQNYDLKRF